MKKSIFITVIIFNFIALQSMQKGNFPSIPEAKRESYHFNPNQAEEELTETELENISPEVVDLMYGLERSLEELNITKENPALEKESSFKSHESLKPEGMSRIMTGKNPGPSKLSPGFPELWYEDSNLENVREAIKKGAPVNQTHPISPLRYAVYIQNIPLILILLQAGALPNATDMSGFSALSQAQSLLRENPKNIKMQQIIDLLGEGYKHKANI